MYLSHRRRATQTQYTVDAFLMIQPETPAVIGALTTKEVLTRDSTA